MAVRTETRDLDLHQEHPSWPAFLHRAPEVALALGLVVVLSLGVALRFSAGEVGDTRTWYDVGRRVLTGASLVGLPEYRYPPTFALLVAPLSLLPFGVFFFAWYAINLGLFAVSVHLALRISFGTTEKIPGRCYWLPGLLVAAFVVDNLAVGQTNILIMALLYWSLLEASRNRGWLAGLPLGAAIAIKAFAAPLLGYFAWRRQPRMFASALLSLAFFLWLLPAPVRGFGRNATEVNLWAQRVVGPYLAHARCGDWGHHGLDYENQSLCAVVRRLLTPADAYPEERHSPTPLYVNLASLSDRQVGIVLCSLFALLVAVFLAACGWQRPRDRAQEGLEYGLAVVGVLLFSAIAWSYFFVLLLLPVTGALRVLRRPRRLSPASVWALRLALGGLGLATLLLLDAHSRALGNLCWATVLWFAVLALACRNLRTRSQHRVVRYQEPPQLP